MRVFLAEKPSQGRDIAAVLGCNQKADGCLYNNDTIVTWCIGHLLGLAQPDAYDEKFGKFDLANLPIIPEQWKLIPNPKTKSQLKIVKDCLKKATEVVIATDADREGELIARLVLNSAKYTGPLKRLWVSDLTPKGIKSALNNIFNGSDKDPLYYAGLARQRADWLMGYNYTPAASLVYGSRNTGVYSVGRVQTPTLAMVVARDYEIENFKSKDFFGITGNFENLKADWVVSESAKGDEEGRCLDKKLVQDVVEKCKGKNANVVLADKSLKAKQAPLCLTISELQKKANKIYGYTSKQTLDLAQSLYEKHKAITYPRSSCGYLPTTQKEDVETIFNNLRNTEYQSIIQQADSNFESRVWNDKKVSEDSHHAIVPTTLSNINFAAMTEKEYSIYDIIVRHYLAQFLGDYKYNETIIELECEGEKFKTRGVIPAELGWKKAFAKEDEEKPELKELPKLSKGQILNCQSLEIQNKKTTPPARYTEETLLSAMENCGRKIEDDAASKILAEVEGIGTGASRSEVIETLKNREYIYIKGKNLISTDKGRALINYLPEELTSVIITADWESKLSKVAKGQLDYQEFLKGIEQVIQENLVRITKQQGKIDKVINNPCPKCGAELVRLADKKTGKGFYWMCTNINNETNPCKTFMDDKAGKPVPQKAKATLEKSGHKCVDCGSDIVKRKGKYGDFPSCMGYPKCTTKYYYQEGKPVKKDI